MGKEIDTTIKEIVNQMNDLGQEAMSTWDRQKNCVTTKMLPKMKLD